MRQEPADEILSSHDDEPPYDGSPVASAPRRRTGTVVGSAALAVTLLAGGGVYAAGRLGGDGAQPESVLPGTAFAMIKVDLEPGDDQSAAIRDLARRFPAAKIGGVGDLRRKVVEEIGGHSVGVADDVPSWLGRRAAFAGFAAPDGTPRGVVAVQVRDPVAAKAALRQRADEVYVAERGDFLVVADDEETLELALAATDQESLAEAADYASDVAKLDGDQVVLGWVDNRRAVAAMIAAMDSGREGEPGGWLANQVKTLEAAAHGRIAVGVHATSTYVELQGVASGDNREQATGNPTDLRRLPDTTIGAVYVRSPKSISTGGLGGFDLAPQFLGPFAFGISPGMMFGEHDDEALSEPAEPICPTPAALSSDSRCAFDPPPASTVSPSPRALTRNLLGQDGQFEEQDDLGALFGALTQLFLPAAEDGLVPHLNGDTTIALGTLPAPGTDRAPDVAVLADVADPRAAADFADDFKAEFSRRFAEDPVGDVKDGRLVLASDAAYRDRLASGGLGDSKLFQLAMGDLGDHVQIAAFVNLERVRDAVPGYPEELRPVSAVGLTLGADDGDGYVRIRVVAR